MKEVWAKMDKLGHAYIDYINNPPAIDINKLKSISDETPSEKSDESKASGLKALENKKSLNAVI